MEDYGNHTEITLVLRRLDLCDILLACTAASQLANDGGKKWKELHDKVKAAIDAEDAKHGF